MKTKQQGATLIELLLVIGLLAFMTMLSFSQKQLEMDQRRAKQIGAQLFIYNNAVRNWISANTGTTPLSVVQPGTTWLKPDSCGGSSGRVDGYIPCGFPDATVAAPITFANMSLSTLITRTYTPAAGVNMTAITTTTPFRSAGRSGAAGDIRSDLAGLAALTAASGTINIDDPTPATTDGSFVSDPLTAIITMETNNRADKDAWLRTDGSNTMNNNLRFASTLSSALRQVMAVSRLQSNNGEVLYIGNKNNNTGFPVSGDGSTALTAAGASRESVVVDANARVYGLLRTNGAITALSGDISASNGNVNASGNVNAGANVNAAVDVIAGRDSTAVRDTKAGRDAWAKRDVIAEENLVGKRFYDINNSSFYVDPDTTSVVNAITTNSVASLTPATALEIKTNTLNLAQQSGGEMRVNGQLNVDNLRVRKNGKYVNLIDLLPNFVFREGWFAMDNTTVPKPSCGAGGVPRIVVVPQTIPTNTTRPVSGYTTPPVGATFFFAVNSGSSWVVRGYTASGSYGGEGTAIATTYCLY